MYDVCALFEAELGLEPGTFFIEVEKDPEKIKRDLKTTGLCDQNLLLSGDLYQIGSAAPLLTKGTDIWKNIDSILRRIARNPDSIERPKISATDRLNVYLKSKIIDHMESIRDNVIKSDRYSQIYGKAKKRGDLKEILNSLEEVIDKIWNKPDVITGILSATKNTGGSSILEESVNAAYVSMFTLKNRKGFSLYSENVREQLVDVGSAALFRDISKIISINQYHPEDKTEHSEKSVEVAEELGLNSNVIYAIRNHHNIVLDETGLTPPSEIAQLYKDIIVVVDLFLNLTTEKNFNENEVIIGLNNLATNGFLDRHSVTSLGDMYIGKNRNFLIANGLRLIKEECKLSEKEAYLWNPKAPVPYAIICANSNCEHIGPLFVDVHIAAKSHYKLGVVPKGTYNHCKKLTKRLMEGGLKVIDKKLVSELCHKLHIKLDF